MSEEQKVEVPKKAKVEMKVSLAQPVKDEHVEEVKARLRAAGVSVRD